MLNQASRNRAMSLRELVDQPSRESSEDDGHKPAPRRRHGRAFIRGRAVPDPTDALYDAAVGRITVWYGYYFGGDNASINDDCSFLKLQGIQEDTK